MLWDELAIAESQHFQRLIAAELRDIESVFQEHQADESQQRSAVTKLPWANEGDYCEMSKTESSAPSASAMALERVHVVAHLGSPSRRQVCVRCTLHVPKTKTSID